MENLLKLTDAAFEVGASYARVYNLVLTRKIEAQRNPNGSGWVVPASAIPKIREMLLQRLSPEC